jgi:AbrB family looped-hinge helix DNA binding protein
MRFYSLDVTYSDTIGLAAQNYFAAPGVRSIPSKNRRIISWPSRLAPPGDIHTSDRKPEEEALKAVVAERGRVTIPKRFRERLDIRPGTILEFREEADKLIAEKSEMAGALDRW